jgi:hypothetical protein
VKQAVRVDFAFHKIPIMFRQMPTAKLKRLLVVYCNASTYVMTTLEYLWHQRISRTMMLNTSM